MKNVKYIYFIACFNGLMMLKPTVLLAQIAKGFDAAAFVNPFIGSVVGNVMPGVSTPFGMLKLSPDVPSPQGWQATNGYSAEKQFAGFSHTHTSGTGGAPRYGNLLVTPIAGKINRTNFISAKRANEHASAGYYQITLQRPAGDVACRLTASHKVGFHQYQFSDWSKNDSVDATIMIDVSSTLSRITNGQRSTVCTAASAQILNDSMMSGTASFKGGWGADAPYTIYFVAVFDQPFLQAGSWNADSVLSIASSTNATAIGLYASYKLKQHATIQLKMAISYISIEKAINNLAEIGGWNFETARQSAYHQWNQYLNKIQVEGGTPEQRTLFYSCLRNTLLMPTDVSGENPGWSSAKPHYWDHYCLWDVFRSVMPLHTLLYPQQQANIVNSLLDIYQNKGWLPDAWIAGHYAYMQGGSNADVVIADALAKGLPGININKAYDAVRKNGMVESDSPAIRGRFLNDYLRYGYLTPAATKGAVSRTMEYAYNDFCIAQVAKKAGKSNDYHYFLDRSQKVFNLFYDSVGYFWAKDSTGNWMNDFSLNTKLAASWNDPYFYEGGSEAYSYYVPHNMQALINRHGGKQNFSKKLDAFFDEGRFNLENETLFLVPYSYNYAGMHFKTSERVRQILNTQFKVGNNGLPGQDDSGAMSSWLVFGSIGFFPVAGQSLYLIGSPVFNKVTVQLNEKKSFTIIAKNNSGKNMYVRAARLNGKSFNRSWITHQEITAGGILELEMSDKISNWGAQDLPFSITKK